MQQEYSRLRKILFFNDGLRKRNIIQDVVLSPSDIEPLTRFKFTHYKVSYSLSVFVSPDIS